MQTKKLLSALLIIISVKFINAQSNYYYYKNEKIYLTIDKTRLSINTSEKIDFTKNFKSQITKQSETLDDKNIQNTVLIKNSYRASSSFNNLYSEIDLSDDVSSNIKSYQTLIDELHNLSSITMVSPCFEDAQGKKIGMSNRFYVKLKNDNDESVLTSFAQSNNVTVIGNVKLMPEWYIVESNKSNKKNALESANLFYESGLFETAEPEFVFHDLLNSSDPLFSQQWGMKNTGQIAPLFAGTDINVVNAWSTTKGAGIKVAVFDQGFELTHPDLAPNVFNQGFDIENGNSSSVVRGNHGTACAGIIGAKQNNIGVSGVAPDVSLTSISCSFSGINTALQFASGFNWAQINGIDVISNSWGGGIPVTIISDAIWNAMTLGRNGKGCVVVFSTGNSNGAVAFPANAFPQILSVGAMSPCGQRKSPTSCDGEIWWGSNFGTALDVMAPGVKVFTTDNENHAASGFLGYTSGNAYTPAFNGTSAACPFAAGVAALVLSVNPGLTGSKVVEIIEKSAKKTRSDLYSYTNNSGRFNGTWNNEMGYGVLDAAKAVSITPLTVSVSIAQTMGGNPSCVGDSVAFTAWITNGGTNPTYNWKINGLSAGTNSNTLKMVSLNNNYVVTCEVVSSLTNITNPQAKSNSIYININFLITPTVSIGQTSYSCQGSDVTFYAKAVSAGNSPLFQWKINGINYGSPQPKSWGSNNGAYSYNTFINNALKNGDIVTCEALTDPNNLFCNKPFTLSNAHSIVFTPVTPLSVSIAIISGTNPTEPGKAITFEAKAVNAGANAKYYWFLNGNYILPITYSNKFTSYTLKNGDKISCEVDAYNTCPGPNGNTAESNIITMNINSPYCLAGSTMSGGINITNVNMGSINNTSAEAISYTNFSNLSTNITVGSSQTLKVTLAAAAPKVIIWVDWNNNKVFTDAGEKIYDGVGGITHTITVNAPAGTSAGVKRMRIRSTDYSIPTNYTSCGDAYFGEVEDYTVNVIPAPCNAGTTNPNNERITNVTMGTINNTSGASSYSNYGSLITNAIINTNQTIKVTLGNAKTTDKIIIWCDWNNNGIFTDAGEQVYASPNGVGPFTASIKPPSGTTTGIKRMRIRLTNTALAPNYSSCGNSGHGEVEDYSLNVISNRDSSDENSGNELVTDYSGELITEEIIVESHTLLPEIYPNPTNGAFTIKTIDEIINVRIINALGQEVFTINQMPAATTEAVNLDNIEKGIYFMYYMIDNKIKNKKIVVY